MRENKGVAWYDIPGSGWPRDVWVLLHPVYTAWHLSYVVIGAALAPRLNWPVLGWTLLAFFLGMGIAAHCYDELHGRPLKTSIPAWVLTLVAGLAMMGAFTIGALVGLAQTWWILPCIAFGGFIALAYDLEWFKGSFHTDGWFALAWGSFPVITAYLAQARTLTIPILIVALAAMYYSLAQRKLSTQSRFFRRKVTWMEGQYSLEERPEGKKSYLWPADAKPIKKETIIGPVDLALKYMTWAIVALAVGLVVLRLEGGL